MFTTATHALSLSLLLKLPIGCLAEYPVAATQPRAT